MDKLSLNQNSTLLINKLNSSEQKPKPQKNIQSMKLEQDPNMENDEIEIKEQQDQASTGGSKKQWTAEQDELVYKLHNEFGNKWALIAQRLKGRTDNCIKNHFYSRLRKGLRKINKLIEDQYKQNFKEFKIIDLYKVIEASDQKFKQMNSYTNEMTEMGLDLKNRIFIFAEQESDGSLQFSVKSKKLLDDLNEFTKNYRRKSKKCRRYSPMGVGSVYRNNSKKSSIIIETDKNLENQNQNPTQQIKQKKQEKTQKNVIKTEPILDYKEKRLRQRKQKPKQKISQTSKQLTLVSVTKQVTPVHLPQQIMTIRTQKGKTYRQFSDDQGEEKDDAQYQKQQRLNHFAENILKTFKSYYSFKSFKSNSAMEQPFFQQ